jgi:hypothetical protein
MPAERVKRWFGEKTGQGDDDDDEYHGINIEGGRKREESGRRHGRWKRQK